MGSQWTRGSLQLPARLKTTEELLDVIRTTSKLSVANGSTSKNIGLQGAQEAACIGELLEIGFSQ